MGVFHVFQIVQMELNRAKHDKNRLNDARLMINIVKKTTCKWACIIIFKHL